MSKICINPDTLFNSFQYGFSQITVAQPGKMVFISGQVAWDTNENIEGADDLAIQIDKAFANLKIAMQEAGGTLQDIVMLRIYKVNYTAGDGPLITEGLQRYFGTTPPASSWISVQGLANPGFMIEIEAQAII